MDSSMVDVAVVGAGPAGSLAAAALAQRGWNVLLLEKDRMPRHKVCGEFLSPEAQDTLDTLGLRNSIAQLLPVPLHHAEITAPGGQRASAALPGTAWGISRYALDATLANAAQKRGATLQTGVTVTNLTSRQGGYELHLRRQGSANDRMGDTLSARAVILAYGRNSRLAEPKAARTQQRTQYVGVKCHFEDVELLDQVELYFFPGGYGGINPVENSRVNFCMLVSYSAFQRAGKSPTAMLDAARAQNRSLDRRLSGARPVASTLKTVAAVDTAKPARPWQDAACIGDAAAMITPLCGDGMAMALRSAEICIPLVETYLRGHMSSADWAREYSRAWHDEFDRRLRIGRMLQAALAKNRVADMLIGLGGMAPPLVSYLMHATRGSARRSP